jgi:hypothetical protein
MLKWFKRLVTALLVICIAAITAFVFRVPLLRGAANAWILDEPPS